MITFGRHTYGKPFVLDWGDSNLTTGNFCSIAHNVTFILGGEHRMDWITTYPFPRYEVWEHEEIQDFRKTKGDIVIGHDVWIGANSTILSGVTLGNGCVVGAGSLVTKSFPPYSIIGGNPAKLIRMRFNNEVIAKLENLKWWEWSDEVVKEKIPLLCSGVESLGELSQY